MSFDQSTDDTLYRAFVSRDARYDGCAYVCVLTTGVFCRLTCPARKPKRENCWFYSTVGECMDGGFRPCKRCEPLRAAAGGDPTVSKLLAALDENADVRWSERRIIQLGYDPSTVRRTFKRQLGITFLGLARQRRLRNGFEVLSAGGKVIAAQQQASFESSSAFRLAFAKLLGCAPASLTKMAILSASWISTPLGDMVAVSSSTHLHLLEFVDRKALASELRRLQLLTKGGLGLGRPEPTEQAEEEINAYFSGQSAVFKTPLAFHGTAFSRQVWSELRKIVPGETCSYGDLARRIGRPSATRAVARANGANQIALMVPCHRVIGADGSLTGYGGGLWRKQRLIEIEQQFSMSVHVEKWIDKAM